MEARAMNRTRGCSMRGAVAWGRGVVCAATLSIAATQLLSCAGTTASVQGTGQSQAAANGAEAGRSARDELAMLAARQASEPDAKAQAVWRQLPGLDAAAMEGGQTEASVMTLAELAGATQTVPAATAGEVDATSLLESQRLYVQGKSLLLAGEVGKGLQALETALRLNPASQELLCEVGDAQLRAGRRLQGVATLRRAATQGALTPRAGWLLGREELRQDDAAAALPHLLRAHLDVDVSRTPVLGAAVHAELARALVASGHLRAASEALAISLDAPVEQFALTIDAREFGDVMRDRPALTMLRGDLASRIGQHEEAIEAYTAAANMAGIDPATPFTRLLGAYLRQGRSAEAATVLLRHIDARQGVVDESLERAATLLARQTDVGSLLVRSLTQHAERNLPAGAQHRLARLAAGAATTRDESRAVLREVTTRAGVDVTTIATLLDTFDGVSGEGEAAGPKLDALMAIVREQPLGAEVAAEAILETGRDVATVLARASAGDAAESKMLAAAMLRRLGRVREAQQALAGASGGGAELELGLVASRAMNAGAAGDVEAARALAASVQGESALALRTRAIAHISAGDAAAARQALAPLLSGAAAEARTDDFLLAADLAVRENAVSEVGGLLTRARELDPSDERVHEAFAALYSPQGAMPNEQLLGEAMREMRVAVPGSQLLRVIIAQDQAQRGLWRQAMPNLRALVNDRGRPAEALDALVRVWERSADDATVREAEAFVRERLASRPESTAWLLAYSRVLLRNKQAAEADAALAQGVASLRSEMLMRQRELVLREGLKQPEAADALLKERLALSPPTLGNALETATLAARQGQSVEALRQLADVAALAGTMQGPQARTVTALVSNAKPEQLRELSQRESEGVWTLMEAARKLQRFAPASELARVQLMAQGRPADSAGLVAACEELRPLSEQIATLAALRVMDALRAREDHSPLIRFVGSLVLATPEPDPSLVNEWVVRTAVRGGPADARFMLDSVQDVRLAQAIVSQYSDAEVPSELQLAKAEIAYVLSNLATSVMRDAMSKACMEMCLELHPRHPWAANNLAYQMLEHGGDMGRIEELVAIAYAELSAYASVVDTKGWLRYKQGQLEDVTLADGTVREGAVTLIERAVAMVEAENEENAELYDHLADALWRRNRAGGADGVDDRERALDLWQKAVKTLDDELTLRRNVDLPGLPRVAEVEAHRKRVEAKRIAAETTGEPDVAAMSVPTVFTPREEPPPIDIDAIWNISRQRQLRQ